MRGRKPKPRVLKLLTGNPGKRKINKREPRVGGPLSPPTWLGKAAKQEWRRLLKAAPPGLLTAGDRQVFAQYCQNVARIAELERIVTEQGYTFMTEKGYLVPRPEMAMLKNLQTIQVRLISEIGLSPSSRTRIEIPEPPTRDAEEDFLFGGKAKHA